MVRTVLLPQRPIQGQLECSSSSSSRTTSPCIAVANGDTTTTPQETMKQDPNPLSKFFGNEPNQMVILSGMSTSWTDLFPLLVIIFPLGPFLSEDQMSNILIARPIPAGYTLIAKPMIGAPPAHPLLICHEALRQVDASKMSFQKRRGDHSHDEASKEEGAAPNSAGPLVMMWTSKHPEGKLVPLRQPEPPVYFQPHC